jgi:hypothetical protein
LAWQSVTIRFGLGVDFPEVYAEARLAFLDDDDDGRGYLGGGRLYDLQFLEIVHRFSNHSSLAR